MKFLGLLVLMTAFTFSVKAHSSDTLTGVWKSNNKGIVSVYHFSKDSLLTIALGKDTTLALYKMDTATVWPKSIDIKVIDRNSKQVLFIQRGLFEFFGPERVRWRLAPMDQARPASFLPRGNEETITLIKQP
jgi:hypothetical protein